MNAEPQMPESIDQSSGAELPNVQTDSKIVLGQAATGLLQLIATVPKADGEPDEEVEATRGELSKTFEKFPILIPALCEKFADEMRKIGYDFGKMRLYMVGGRVVGSPLKANSDIDLFFAFEKPMPTGLDEKTNPSREKWIELRNKLLFGFFRELCEENGIGSSGLWPGKFQVLGWGHLDSDHFLESQIIRGDYKLLYEVDY